MLLSVGGTRLFVHTEGAGPPVLVVHGGPLLDHGYLAGPLRSLTSTFRLVFYDQRLSGRSDGVVESGSVSLADFVEDLEGIREGLALERVRLIGHSWGGLVAVKYALRHPDRVQSLVLVSPMAPSAALWRAEQEALTAAVEPSDTAGMGELRASQALAAREPEAVQRMLRLSFRSQLHDPARAAELRFHIPADYAERSRQFGSMVAELTSYDLVGELADLEVPTLLVHGASEVAAAIGREAYRAGIEDLTIEVIEEAGHFSFLEQPEAFHGVVRAFLSGR